MAQFAFKFPAYNSNPTSPKAAASNAFPTLLQQQLLSPGELVRFELAVALIGIKNATGTKLKRYFPAFSRTQLQSKLQKLRKHARREFQVQTVQNHHCQGIAAEHWRRPDFGGFSEKFIEKRLGQAIQKKE
ncbi:hypothetical protein SS50377_22533 [Spironucleus salmonicida]|uniref:Uncharacterized protein n=1 Tax=Spironucleus salmonicida TaxID=348837 RepID=V6LBY8_9EUKA|nr:hypothetical protein SS50377_22533 [Spironucleus salmonicida]|eukprot:EST41977.1 Hypothetical protein SS50377_18282 [Spironucleus salmonicida]